MDQPYVEKAPRTAVLSMDAALKTGKRIRPLHGVNSGPMTKVFTYDARPQFVEAGFPFARLHDVEYPYGSGQFVDIPNLFRNFDADENDEKNYDFDLTDLYVEKIIETGCEPLFRLGVSIEHAPIRKHTYPPKDFEKWARICEHVIRHYNEGWANGHHWNIRYWEIWNEADGSRSGSIACWAGTAEEFYRLYTVTARHLKKRFPELKIGGPSFTRPVNEFVIGFFEYLKAQEEPVPLDFYSWHLYHHDPTEFLKKAKEASEILKRYGYERTESVMDEWNLGHRPVLEKYAMFANTGERFRAIYDQRGSSLSAAVLALLETGSDVDLACYFEADVVKEWCGLYRVKDMSIGRVKATVQPTNVCYAFKSFNELYKLSNEAAVGTDGPDVYAAAAVSDDGRRWGILLSNYSDTEVTVLTKLKHVRKAGATVRIANDRHLFEIIATEIPKELKLEPFTFAFIGNVL